MNENVFETDLVALTVLPALRLDTVDTVKNDCPVQIFRKMMKYLKI